MKSNKEINRMRGSVIVVALGWNCFLIVQKEKIGKEKFIMGL